MTTIELYVTNFYRAPIDVVQKVIQLYQYFNINVRISGRVLDRYHWMESKIEESSADIIGFIDCKFVPISPKAIFRCIDFLGQYRSMIGVVGERQKSSSIHSHHQYIHPDLCFIYRPFLTILDVPKIIRPPAHPLEFIHLQAERKMAVMRHIYPNSFYHLKSKNDILDKYGVVGGGVIYGEREFFGLNMDWSDETVDYFLRSIDNIKNGITPKTRYLCNDIDLYYSEVNKLKGETSK